METRTKEQPIHKRTEIRRAFQKIRPKMDFVLGSEYDAFKQMAIVSQNSPIPPSFLGGPVEVMNLKILYEQSAAIAQHEFPEAIRKKLALTETIRRLANLKKQDQNGLSEPIGLVIENLKKIAGKCKAQAKSEANPPQPTEIQAPPAGGGRDGFLGF